MKLKVAVLMGGTSAEKEISLITGKAVFENLDRKKYSPTLVEMGKDANFFVIEKKKKNVMALDERTMRMLVEKPDNLKKLFIKKLHANVTSKRENYKYFEGAKIIRSAELVYIAYKKKLVNLKNGIVLDALLYAVKFNGCSISDVEIEEIKGL